MVKILTDGSTGLSRKALVPNYERYEQWQKGLLKDLNADQIACLPFCNGFINNIYITEGEEKMESKREMFRGKTIPMLHFEFIGKVKDGEEAGYYDHSFGVIDPYGRFQNKSSCQTGFEELARYIAHFSSVITEDGLNLDIPFDIFDTVKNRTVLNLSKYQAMSVEEVLAGFKSMFDSVVNHFFKKAPKGTEAALRGKEEELFIKLTINDYKNDKFTFSSFRPSPGGNIERAYVVSNNQKVRKNRPHSLLFDKRYDSIVPSEKAKPSAVAQGGGVVQGGAKASFDNL